MPDNETEPKTAAVVLTEDQKAAIRGAKAPGWKKAQFWILGVLVILLIFAVVVAVIVATRGKSNLVRPIVDRVKAATGRADMEAKITAAKAAGAEKAALDELDRIKKIEDEDERNKRLAEIL